MRLLAIALIALTSATSWAATSEKFAVLDPMGAILLTKEAKAAEKAMKKELASDQKRLESIQSELKELAERSNRDKDIMGADQKEALQKSIRDLRDEGKFLSTKLQKRVQEEQQAILAKMQPKLKEVLGRLVEERQFTMIVNRQAAIYTSDAADITNEVVKLLDEAK